MYDKSKAEMLEYIKGKDDEIKALEEENEKLLDETLLLKKRSVSYEERYMRKNDEAMKLMLDSLDIIFEARNIRNRQYLYWFIIGVLSVAVAYLFFK